MKKEPLVVSTLILLLIFISCNNSIKNKYSESIQYNNAANFTKQNIENQFYYDGWLENYKDVYDYSQQLIDSNYNKNLYNFKIFTKWNSVNDKLGYFDKQLSYMPKSDDNVIDKEYILKNTIQTFKSLERVKWKKYYDTNTIYNGILPYKIYNEKPEYWREIVIADFKSLSDSICKIKNPIDAAFYIGENLRKSWKHSYGVKRMNVVTPYQWLHKYKIGICEHRLMYATYVTRAFGIATYIDFSPQWANRSGSHSWVSVVDTNRNTLAMNIAEDSILPSKNEVPFHAETGRKTPKVFRRTFEKQPYSLKGHAPKSEIVENSFLYNENIIDVTEKYLKTNNIQLSISEKVRKKHKITYLCVFDNENWVPIDWAEIKNSKVLFKKIARDVVYLPMVFDSELIPIAVPFLLDTNGSVHNFIVEKSLQTLQLSRKYPLFPRIDKFYKSVIGGKFQVANKEDFSDSVDIYRIDKYPKDGFNTMNISNKNQFKYLRYKGPKNSYAQMAENYFFNQNGDTIKGIPFSSKSVEFNDAKAINDNDFLTYFEGLSLLDSWVGLKFNQPQKISKITFMPRTDANFIYQKNYKTFYWNDKWVELPNRIENGKLIVRDAPKNALYFVRQVDLEHNRWDGKEQRIFSYENEVLAWW